MWRASPRGPLPPDVEARGLSVSRTDELRVIKFVLSMDYGTELSAWRQRVMQKLPIDSLLDKCFVGKNAGVSVMQF